jgi:hypothetical protein
MLVVTVAGYYSERVPGRRKMTRLVAAVKEALLIGRGMWT